MKIWEYVWFQKFINWCRKWEWFDKNIYGKSENLEDFVRNPAEVLRDNYFPFVIKGVKAYSIVNMRLGYITFDKTTSPFNSWSVPMGDNLNLIWRIGKWTILDARFFNVFWTKYCNAIFFIQLVLSFKYYIPIPYFSINFRLGKDRYCQIGLGWGPEHDDAVLCGKLRYVNQQTSSENQWNPTDVTEYYEGTI